MTGTEYNRVDGRPEAAPLRILMLSDVFFPRVNGVSTSIHTFARSFLEQGHSLTLIAPEYPYAFDAEFEVLRIPSRRLPLDPEDRLMSLRAIKRLTEQLRQRRFDLVHIQTPFVAHYAGVHLARNLGLKAVVSYHTFFEAYFEEYLPWLPGPWLRALARSYSRRQCNEVDAVVSPSTQMLERLREYGVTTEAAVIPTGLPLAQFERSGPLGFRANHGIADDALLLLYVGRVAHEKNIEFLMTMFTRVQRQVASAKLVIAGEGPALEGLKRRAGDMGQRENILFIGYLERSSALIECYHASDVFVFASQTETQGLVLLEAMACGLPVVSTASMGSKDVLRDGQGCLISALDIDRFAAHVVSLARDPARAVEIARRGRVYVQGWSTEAKAEQMLAFYRRVLEASRAEAAQAAPLPHDPSPTSVKVNEG